MKNTYAYLSESSLMPVKMVVMVSVRCVWMYCSWGIDQANMASRVERSYSSKATNATTHIKSLWLRMTRRSAIMTASSSFCDLCY